ncbi:radical SAM/SPASM domain-containing protein [Sulfurivermis fontis]|uniref:radical SAM/SPASM domain-containing protein n=1 Tax=Sulfurivermis fontis TaxID=1972068 RepID=UPI000FDB2B78|nr:radical SAM protein [Sulfurivermis fontis]
MDNAAPQPQLISWNLTRVCNLACSHCYLDAVQRRIEAPDELSTAEALDVMAQIAAVAPGAMLVLTGGEPLLRRDLNELVAQAAQGGLMPVIGTNGTLLDAARAQSLREAGAAGVGISLDSVTPEFHDQLRGVPGAWARAVAGLRAAQDAGLGVLVQTTLFEENRHELEALADFSAHLGAMALNLFFLVCTGRGVTQTDLTPETYEATLADILRLQQGRSHLTIRARCAPYARRLLGLHAGETVDGYASWSSACLAGRTYLRITPQGEVTPCPYIPATVGSLRSRPLADIWQHGAAFGRLRNELPMGKCGDCDYRHSCGGCRARALATGGDLMAEDGKCRYVKPFGAAPESAPVAPQTTISWDDDARVWLERIPAFVRGRVRARIEEKAAQAGLSRVTAAFMQANRPSMPFAMRGRPHG